MRKNCFSDRENFLRIRKIFEIARTIYSNSERSEQLLVTECFFNLFLEVSHLIDNRRMSLQTDNAIHGQTIHPIENFITLNFLKFP